MKDADKLLARYLEASYVMQVATVSGSQPWSCTVYYVCDDKLNLYWASLPSRRHSREIEGFDKTAVAIAVEHDKNKRVIGVQAEGTAKMVRDPGKIRPAAEKYAEAFGRDNKWVEDFSKLKTEHRLYKFTPVKYVLFDEQNFHENPRREINING